MANTPTSKSTLLNNAAKDDVVGLNGDFNFTISDLLANDPGGAGKVDLTKQFFFGDTAPGVGIPSIVDQVAYLTNHGITAHLNDTGTAFVSFDIGEHATDINYFVQIGNKGTWSEAHVTIGDTPEPPPVVDTHHNGALAAEWTFENYTAAGGDNVGTPSGFWNMNEWVASHPGEFGTDADLYGYSTNIQVHGEDGHRALDTAASPGNIFLQAIVPGYNGASMPDLVAGKDYHAEVSILKQDYTHVPGMIEAGTEGTDPDAWVSFQFNGTELNVHASDARFTGHNNEFVTFDVMFKGIAGQDSFFIQSHGTHDDNQGLLIDNIAIHDWIV